MQKIPEDIKSIDERISKLKKNYANRNREDKHTEFSHLAVGLQVAIEIVSASFVGAAIGYLMDKIFDFDFIFLVLLTILGGIAGFINVIRYVKQVNANKERGKNV